MAAGSGSRYGKLKQFDELGPNGEFLMEFSIYDAIQNGFDYEKAESDFIFLHFILNYLPVGLIGLIIALILSAAMSSTSAEISALSAISTIDIYKRFISKVDNPKKDVLISKFFNLGWGIIAILFSLFFAQEENLIESINIIASLLYGNVLAIFLVAFFIKKIRLIDNV